MLFWLETKKIVTSASLIGFLLLCLVFNMFLIIAGGRDGYTGYIADVSETTGYVINDDFAARLAQLDTGEYKDALQAQTSGMLDVFDGYDTANIAEGYIRGLGLSGGIADAMREKYIKLQDSVDAKAATDESLTLYFASSTYNKHAELFGTVLHIVLLEGLLISALIMLLSVGYEHASGTAQVVYATKIGRKVLRPKLLASVAAGIAAYILLTGATLAVYFAVNPFGDTLGSSISSGFNYFHDYTVGMRPFVTWQSFTVFTYLLASVGISALIALCFGLMAFSIGTWIKNSYIGFLLLAILSAALITVGIYTPPTSIFGYYFSLTPVWLWMRQSIWFTDGGGITLWRSFETLGVCASLAALIGIAAFSAIRFRKRDIL